jgi:hypothetical protein
VDDLGEEEERLVDVLALVYAVPDKLRVATQICGAIVSVFKFGG